MAINKIEIQNSTGDIYYPHTSSDVVKHGNRTLSAFLTLLENKFKSYLPLSGGTVTGHTAFTSTMGQHAGTITDFNRALTEGEYSFGGSGLVHSPIGNTGYGKLIVKVSDGGTHDNANNWIWQTAYLTNSNKVYRRSKTNSDNWTNWALVYTTSDKPRPEDIGAVAYDETGDTTGTYPRIYVPGKEWIRTPSGGIVPYSHQQGYVGRGDRAFYDVNTIHINGKHVGGHSNNVRWDIVPVVGSDGGMEIGQYIDFHNVKSDTSDYTFRFENPNRNVCVYHGTLSQYSDRRLKEDIKYIDDIQMLSDLKIKKEEYKFKDFIKEIRFATFKYKESKEDTFGFIAQDLENFEVADYMLKDVTTNAVNDIDADENGKATYKSFDTMAYVSVVAKALQEEINHRDKQIESLEEKIKLLEKKINALVS